MVSLSGLFLSSLKARLEAQFAEFFSVGCRLNTGGIRYPTVGSFIANEFSERTYHV